MRDVSVVADIAGLVGILHAPLCGGFSEKSHVEDICLGGVDMGGLRFGEFGRNQMGENRVGVDAIIDLGEISLDIPAQSFSLLFFEALKFLDEIQLEFDRNPGGEFEGNVFVRVGAAITTGCGGDANGGGFFDLLLGCENKAVKTGLIFNPIEFDGIKTGVVEVFPDAEKFDCVAIAQPIEVEIISAVRIFVTCDVGKTDVVFLLDHKNGHFSA